MKIVSVTMAGVNTLPGGAIASCRPLCDSFIVDRPGEIRDFAAARNRLLDRAREEGFDWAVMIDTDERLMKLTGQDAQALRNELAHTDADVIMVKHRDGTYEKERLFRLASEGHYEGPIHEAFITTGKRITWSASTLTFTELPKSQEQVRAKLTRDREILLDYVDQHPDDPRWWYYLGDTEANLGRDGDAAIDFQHCFDLNGWDEEGAWAAYRAAEVWSRRERYEDALNWCTRGLRRRADFPELHWLAGWCCYQLGRYEQAIVWSRLAIRAREARGGLSERIGFRYPPAHYEAPYDVIRWAWRALGDNGMAGLVDETFEEKLHERQKGGA